MGRNDFGGVVALSFRVALLLFFAFAFSSEAFAQASKGDSEEEETLYKIALKYPQDVRRIYKMTQTEKVRRQYSDSTVKEFERVKTSYLTVHYPKIRGRDLLTVSVVVDSIEFKFKEGDAEVYYNSQNDSTPAPMKMQDFLLFTGTLGRSFDLIYSPYGYPAKMESEDADWLRNYVEEKGAGALDEISEHIWLNAVSFENLAHIGDINKIGFPEGRIPIDSVWKTPFRARIGTIDFVDTTSAKIEEFNAGIFNITAEMDSLTAVPGEYRVYGIDTDLVEVVKSAGQGTYAMEISPTGIVNSTEANLSVSVLCKFRREVFKQQMNCKIEYELLGLRNY